MKKIVIALTFLFVVALMSTSCRTTKPLCPAYRSQINTEIPKNIN
jgi:hypothetical protein